MNPKRKKNLTGPYLWPFVSYHTNFTPSECKLKYISSLLYSSGILIDKCGPGDRQPSGIIPRFTGHCFVWKWIHNGARLLCCYFYKLTCKSSSVIYTRDRAFYSKCFIGTGVCYSCVCSLLSLHFTECYYPIQFTRVLNGKEKYYLASLFFVFAVLRIPVITYLVEWISINRAYASRDYGTKCYNLYSLDPPKIS